MDNWPTCHQPLPRPVAPAPNETIESYLRRLATTNQLDPSALRTHLSGDTRKSTPIPLTTLALVSGQRPHALRYAIPELSTTEDPATTHTHTRPSPGGSNRRQCLPCTHARGHHGEVWCWNHHDDVICFRHLRWIGDGSDHPDAGQPDLSNQPGILQANRRHRALIHRYGRDSATTAFREARYICRRWHDRGEHQHDFLRLMSLFHGHSWQVTASDPTIHAARYPQIVELIRLVASPFWRAKAQQDWPEPTEFISEIQRTVAPRFRWTLHHPRGVHDPLVELIINQRRKHHPSTCLR
jgi:hypothetical protein